MSAKCSFLPPLYSFTSDNSVDNMHTASTSSPETIKGNARADRLAGKPAIASGLHHGRSAMLRSSSHYLRAQSKGHHTIDCLAEGGVERGNALQSSLVGREKAIGNQSNIGTDSKAAFENV